MKKNIHIKINIFFFLLSMPVSVLLAQKNLDPMTIISTGAYKPTVMDAAKINENPTIIDSIQKIKVSEYGINSKVINTNFDVEPIKPAQMVGEPLTKLYNTMLKLGGGTYNTPYGELWYNLLRSKENSFGIRVKHLSSSYTPVGYGYAGYSNDEGSLYGKWLLKEHSLIGNIDYTRNMVHAYGYNPQLYSPNRDSTSQIFNFISGNLELKSHYSKAERITHDILLSSYILTDRFKTFENNLKINGMMETAVNKGFLKINASVDYYDYKAQKDTVNNTIVNLNPNFIMKSDKYFANIGFTATSDVFLKSTLYLYPNIDLSCNFENIIIPYGGITGGLQKNSFKTFTDVNPFVSSDLTMNNSNKKYDLYGGFKGTLSSTTSYNTYISYYSMDHMALFVNDTTGLKNKFNVIYDNATVFNAHGEVAYQMREKLRINLRGDYFDYKMQTEVKAWYMPKAKVTLSGNYNLADKIVVKLDLFYINDQFAKTFATEGTSTIVVAKELKGVLDANIGGEYRYTKKLGFFLNVNNIANVRYYRWSNYPTQRFSLMGGLSYSF